MKLLNKATFILFTMFFCGLTFADVIQGTILFDKRPAKAGVIYEHKSSFKEVNGVINQQGKKFTEMIGVSSHLGKVDVKNNDKFEHNIFANDIKQNIKFDIGLMLPGTEQQVKTDWQPNTIVRIGCKIHPKMRSYIANIPSDNYVSFEFEKKQKEVPFQLTGIGRESTKFTVLLAGMENVEVELTKGETKTVDILKKGKKAGSVTFSRS